MHKFVRSLITEWRKLGLPFSDEAIVVAVSGGADSMSLLLAIHDLVKRKKLSLDIVVAHFNHKLRGKESDADERFVREQAKNLGFEFVHASEAVARSGNLEQNARNARYRFLSDVAKQKGASIILTAHTRNDQAETFLINLIRGSGIDGLAGMRSIRDFDASTKLVRPLLGWAHREDTEAFCRDVGIEYRLDGMNEDTKFTRTRLRKTILPALSDLNPKIVDSLARTSELLRLEIEAAQERDSHDSNPDLAIKDLKALKREKLYSQLRRWLRSARGDLRGIGLAHIQAIERLIASSKSGKTVEIPGGGRVVKHKGRLTFRNIKVEK